MNKSKTLGIYLHIPFCVKKCRYCDFLSAPAAEDVQRRYMEALRRDIASCERFAEDKVIDTVFFGGGTPSILPGDEIAETMDALRSVFTFADDMEISLEANPGTFGTPGDDKPVIWRQAGINRLSIGLQSADAEELKLLGRIHTYEDFLDSYDAAEKAGFTNLNVDLMSALPGADPAVMRETIRKVLSLSPVHLSVYSLILEPGTPLAFQYAGREESEEDEIREREIYWETSDTLREAGYHHYEISNFALPGFESRHNRKYWQCDDVLGLGLGATSYVDHRRFRQPDRLETYLSGFGGTRHLYRLTAELTPQERMEEFCFLALRTDAGIDPAEFALRFDRDFYALYGDTVETYTMSGHLCEENGRIRLTRAGIDVSNVIMADFLLDSE